MDEKIQVLHINCNYLGTALHQVMIRKLNELTDNLVFCPYYKGAFQVTKPDSNVIADPCFSKWDRVVFSYKQRKIIRAIKKRVSVKSFSIIHAYTLFTDGNVAMKLSKEYGIPFVVAIRDTDVNDFFKYRPWLINRGIEIMKNASAVFFLSESYKTNVINNYIPKDFRNEIANKTYVVPNGIDDFWLNNTPDITDNKEIGNSLNVIFAGKIIKRKNIPMIQKALEEVRKKGIDAKLTVVGNALDKSELGIILKDPYTKYVEAKPKEELIHFYRKSDLFCMPSHQETFGLVYAEAMSQGLPVIYTKGQGFDGQFEDGFIGYSVNCNDYVDIMNKIILLKNNYTTIQRHTIQGSKRFNWDDIVNKYFLIYTQILMDED